MFSARSQGPTAGLSPLLRRPRSSYGSIALCALIACLAFTWFPPVANTRADDAAKPAVAVESAAEQTPAAATEAAHDHSTETESHGDHGADDAHAGEHKEEHAEHHSPVAPLLAAIVMVLFGAKIVGDLFERIGMPAVLGELFVGILLGNLAYLTGMFGPEFHGIDFLHSPAEGSIGNPYDPGAALKMLAEIGVVLLLFEVGLESNVRDMLRVGASSMLVAVLGVVAPMLLGVGVGWFFLPDRPFQTWLFLGATLCATSVGITARVLKDLGRSQQKESKIILGAAVIDDVLGLVVLAIVSGIIQQAGQGGEFALSSLLLIIGKAFGFLFAAIVVGSIAARPTFKAACYLQGHGLLLATSLVICFGFSYLATLVDLAPIVGAFAAGLILEHTHYQELGKKENIELEEAIKPLTALLVPIFFVQMGVNVDLSSFLTNPSVWALAGALTVAAIIGKQVCALGVLEKGLNKLAVGLGMIPRGEVGLIFAGVGLSLRMPLTPGGPMEPVVQTSTYSAIVVMVMVTTMVTPPLLKWSLGRPTAEQAA